MPPKNNSKRPEKRKRKASRSPSPHSSISKKARKTSLATSNRSAGIIESLTPSKSPLDHNEYKFIRLSNGLSVLLISIKTDRGDPGWSSMSSTLCRHSLTEDIIPNNPWNFFEPTLNLQEYFKEDRTINYINPFALNPQNLPTTSIALVVNVGSLDDPVKAKGVAHFAEHLVHFGSAKFPRENQVKEIVRNFGTANAATAGMWTAYFNQVCDTVLDRNLELFSEMLHSPSFNVDHIRREVNAVDDEFYFRQPYFRSHLLLNHVGIQNASHPLASFGCGNFETLGGGTDKGSQRIQRKLRENHGEYYVASAMTLAITSSKTIPELEDLVLTHFSKITEGDRLIRHETDLEDSKVENIKLPEKEVYIYLQGISSSAQLTLRWCLPASTWLSNRKEKTLPVLQLLLSNTSRKSLYSSLINEGLIWELGVYFDATPFATLVEMEFALTPKGQKNISRILKATFDYTKFIRENVKEAEMKALFKLIRAANLLKFHFGSHLASLTKTFLCALKMQSIEQSKDILTFDSWNKAEFNYSRVITTLEFLQQSRNLIVIETLPKQIKLEERMKEEKKRLTNTNLKIQIAPYTKAKYFVAPRQVFSPTQLHGSYTSSSGTLLEMEMNLISSQPSEDENFDFPPDIPENFGDIPPLRLSYTSKMDLNGNVPKVSGVHVGHPGVSYSPFVGQIKIDFISHQHSSSRKLALAWLWATAIEQNLLPFRTEFDLGGYNFLIVPNANSNSNSTPYIGLTMTVSGFPMNFEKVVETILITVLKQPISEICFSTAKVRLRSDWEHFLGTRRALPVHILKVLLYEQADLSIDFLGILDELTLDDLNCHIRAFRVSTHAVIKLLGNLSIKTFYSTAAFLDTMEFGPIIENSQLLHGAQRGLTPRPEMFTPGENCIRLRNYNNYTFTNSIKNLYVLGNFKGRGYKESECYRMAMSFINYHAFMFLRTKEQLAYAVQAGPLQLELKQPMMIFVVLIVSTAKKHSPCKLDSKIDECLANFGEYLRTVPDFIFDNMKKLKKFPSNLTKEDVFSWWDSRFGPGFKQRDIDLKCAKRGIKKITIQELSMGNSESVQKSCTCKICSSISEWKNGRNFGSSLQYAVGKNETKHYFKAL